MKPLLRIDNRIRIAANALSPEARIDLRAAFTHVNPEAGQAERLMRQAEGARGKWKKIAWARAMAARNAPKTIATWKASGGLRDGDAFDEYSFPRGGLGRVYDVLDANGIDFEVVDERSTGLAEVGNTSGYRHRVELRDYQRALVDAALVKENGYWRSDTGSGKTTAALGFIVAAGLPALVIVWTSNLLTQWRERASRELGVPLSEIGVFAGGQRNVRPITIGMQQTLWSMDPARLDALARMFGTVVCDELDRFASRTFDDVIDRMTSRYRIGVSADERRKDGQEFRIYDAFGGQLGPDIARAELIARGNVVDVAVHAYETGYAPEWYLDTPSSQRGMRFNELLDAMTCDAERNAKVLDLVVKEVEAGEQIIVFSHRVDHCLRLEADLRQRLPGIADRTGRLVGGPEGAAEFARTVTGLRAGRVCAAFGTYQAITYGTDLPSVARGLCATPMHSNLKTLNQVRGRLCRASEGKSAARLLYPWDRALFGLEAIRQLRRMGTASVEKDGALIEAREFLRQEDRG